MGDWLWKFSAKAAKRAFWAFILSAGGLAVIVASTWQGFMASPPLLQVAFVLSISVLLVAAASAAIVYLNAPVSPYRADPKYLLWYMSPHRRISWRFGCFLGMSGGERQPVVIHGFQFSLKVNRGSGITPKAAWIECIRTGTKHVIKFDARHSGDASTYKEASEIEFIPSGVWLNGADWSQGMSKEQFFALFHDMIFNFEYEGGNFRRKFSRREMRQLVERFEDIANPAPTPRVRLRVA